MLGEKLEDEAEVGGARGLKHIGLEQMLGEVCGRHADINQLGCLRGADQNCCAGANQVAATLTGLRYSVTLLPGRAI